MPFKSEAQRKYMWANHPAIARRWEKKYGKSKTEPTATQNRKTLTGK